MTARFYGLLLLIASLSRHACAEALLIEGVWSQGGFARGEAPVDSALFLNEKTVKLSDQGLFAFGFGRDASPEQTLRWCRQNACQSYVITLTQREYPEQRITGVPQKTVNPPAEVTARIRAETAQVGSARDQSLPDVNFVQTFLQPLDGPKTGVYGSRRVYNGVPKRPHYGVDYAAPVGTAVVAPADAVVTLAHDNMYFSGGTLIMDHGMGISSTFIHLHKLLVAVGEQVKQGQVVAEVGKGGRATGPHLDWRVNWHDVRIDPELVLALGDYDPQPIDRVLAAKQALTTNPQ